MTLQIVRIAFVMMLTASLFINQVVVTAFQSSSKIQYPSLTNPNPLTTNYESCNANVVAIDHKRHTVPITMMASAWLLSTMMMLSSPLPAWSQQTDIAQGQVLFQANCAGCHAGGNNYVQEKRTLRKDDIQQYRGSTDQAVIANFVQNGLPHKLFPMKAPMEEKDYNDVVAYVLDQALGEKW